MRFGKYRILLMAFACTAIFHVCSFANSIIITSKITAVNGAEKQYSNITGGDTIFLEEGQRGPIQFSNISGSRQKYVVVINAGGLCEIKTSSLPYGISIRNCHYFKLTGNTDKKTEYGIRVSEVNHEGAGIGISNKSDHITLAFTEVCNTQGPGILCKTEPDCNTSAENYTQRNIFLHHNYVHHTGTEGLYIGSTAFEGVKLTCDSAIKTILPPMLDSVFIFDNVVEYTGWDGIQVSNAKNVNCMGNHIGYDSQKQVEWQNCGLIIGGGTSGEFTHNFIIHGKGYGINCFGNGEVVIKHNHLVLDDDNKKVAIYLNNKLGDDKTHYKVANNIIETTFLPAIKAVIYQNTQPAEIRDNDISPKPKKDAIVIETAHH